MFVSGILMASTNLLFSLLAWSGKSELLFAIAVIFDDMAAAFATVACVAFISMIVDRTYTATQYALLASIGTAGVPGVGLIMLGMVLNQVGLPLEGIALIIGVDRVLDMKSTQQDDNDASARPIIDSVLEGFNGTIFAYGIDIFHRATNITKSGAYRYAVTSCFKKAGNDKIGFTAWPYHQQKPWRIIFENASPEQLNCFGVPMPGDPFWDQNTLQLANLRYPGWDMSEYKKKIMTK